MREFRLRNDLERAVVGTFALPLGIEPIDLPPPTEGYTLDYELGKEGDADSYNFHIVVSHDRLGPLLASVFQLLEDRVTPIVEIGSRDAYRSIDTYVSREPISRDDFLSIWTHYEPVLMEDASLGAGATCEESDLEVFLDSWKGLSIHCPVNMRRQVAALLAHHEVGEVPSTWPEELDRREEVPSNMREVLVIEDDQSPDIDEILLQLRDAWSLELDVDPEENLDDQGRRLGLVLWHVIALCSHASQAQKGAYLTFWLSASSLTEVERLVSERIDEMPEWDYQGFYSVDRVAFDERPETLSKLPLRRTGPEVHSVRIDEC